MNDNTTLLQKEIERLNFIISLLIEKNRELERKLQSISLQNTSSRRPFLSDQENREELNTTNGSILPQAELINGEIHNLSVKAIESNQSAYSNVKELEQSNQSAEPKLSTDIDINMVHPENIYR